MARRRTKAQRDKDAELKAGKLSDLREQVSKLDGLRRLMADDLLAAYVEVYSDYEALNETLARDGLLVDVERGGENNRHVERVKHPGFDMHRPDGRPGEQDNQVRARGGRRARGRVR